MRKQALSCSGFALAAMAGVSNAATITVNTNDDPIGANLCPAVCSLRHAITAASVIGGDTIVFAPNLASPITLTQGEIQIDRPLTIRGPGARALTISAQNASRVLVAYASATISDLEIAHGTMTGANGADGANLGEAGAPGASAAGGCVLIPGGVDVVFDRVAIRDCRATGGNGGNGVAGLPGPPLIASSNGGAAGNATGGAIDLHGTLSLLDSSVVDAHAIGGTGGKGGHANGGLVLDGFSGDGGSASGGAIYAHDGAGLRIANSTIANGFSTAGNSPTTLVLGHGGNATAGLVFVGSGLMPADLEFSTLANGTVVAGTGLGHATASANAINAGTNLVVLSSIIVGAQSGVTLCAAAPTSAPASVNLGEDASCGFSAQATLAQTLNPLDVIATPWPAYAPVAGGPAVDAAATCLDIAGQAVTADQHGAPRPQGAKCDLGAIEFQSDDIFADGFDG